MHPVNRHAQLGETEIRHTGFPFFFHSWSILVVPMSAPTPACSEAPVASEHILPLIAGKDVFGIELRRLREAGGMTRAELSRQPISIILASVHGNIVAEAVRASERFSRSETFVEGGYSKLAQSFIDSKSALSQVGEVLAAQIELIPVQIVDWHVTVDCRGLATAALLAVRGFRKGTVERLKTEHVRIINGKVHLNIPASIVKNRRPIQGPLPEVPWLHRIMVIYTEKARPLLLPDEDQGYWFTTQGASGGRASHTVLYNDIRRFLGVNPHAMRYVLATDGKRRNLSDEDIAEVLCHTPEMTRHIYQKIDAEDRNGRANHTIARILGASLTSF